MLLFPPLKPVTVMVIASNKRLGAPSVMQALNGMKVSQNALNVGQYFLLAWKDKRTKPGRVGVPPTAPGGSGLLSAAL